MKTPEEIKKGLKQCTTDGADCTGCIYRDECMEEYDNAPIQRDALAYIQQLEEGIDRVYELAKGLRLQISQLENQIANAGKMATMKEVAECLKHMGIDCCYGEDDHD